MWGKKTLVYGAGDEKIGTDDDGFSLYRISGKLKHARHEFRIKQPDPEGAHPHSTNRSRA